MARKSKFKSARRGFLPANQPYHKAVASSLREDLRRLNSFVTSQLPEKTLLEMDPVRDAMRAVRTRYTDVARPPKRVHGGFKTHYGPRGVQIITRASGLKPLLIYPAGTIDKERRTGMTAAQIIREQRGWDPDGRLDDVFECVERSERREVLFAEGGAGAGKKVKAPRYTDKSQVDC